MALSRLLPAQNRKNEMVRQLVRLLSVNEYPDYKLNEKGVNSVMQEPLIAR